MTEICKIIHGVEKADKRELCLSLSSIMLELRGVPVKLVGSRFRRDKRKYFFIQ